MTTDRLHWSDDAACKDVDGDLFYPDEHDKPAIEKAKAICGRCPVKHDCLEDALTRTTEDGIRGGMTRKQRAFLRTYRAQAGRTTIPMPDPTRQPEQTAADSTVTVALRGNGSAIGHTRAVPVPTKAQPIRPVQRRNTSPFTTTAPAAPDPDAIARLAEQTGSDDSPRGTRPGRRRKHIDIASAARDYENGDSIDTLSARYGLGAPAMRNRLAEHGVTIRPRVGNRAVDIDIEAAANAYNDGASAQEIADRFGISKTAAVRHLKNHGVTMRASRKPPVDARSAEDRTRAIKAYRDGATVTAIAVQIGTSKNTIRRWLDKAQVPRSDGRDANGGAATGLRQLMAEHDITSRDVRTWALATGRPVTTRGIPPQTLVEAYIDEHATTRKASA